MSKKTLERREQHVEEDFGDCVDRFDGSESTVVAMGEHIIIELEDGTELELGMGPMFYREEIGFATEVGDEQTITGFHEDGEFKVLSIVDESGTLMTFRDEYGRPGWAGRGNRDSQATK